MIRINLLPTREAKRNAGGTAFVAVWIGLVLAVLAGMYLWYAALDEERNGLVAEVGRLKATVAGLNEAKAAIEKRTEQKEMLARQNDIFDRLKYGKTGPALAMAYLSYVLTPREDNLYNVDELRAREDAGWDLNWDPARLWFTTLKDAGQGSVVIEGEALDHTDVTELHRRLEASNLFYNVRLGIQELRTDDKLGARYVSFKMFTDLNYDPNGIPTPVSQVAEQGGAPAAPAGGGQ